MSSKDEYPPLLAPGLHKLDLSGLKTLVVDPFSISDRRQLLWGNFVQLLDKMKAVGLRGEIWVDGSFLTEKINPGDVDFVFDAPVDLLEHPTPAQAALLDQLATRAFRKTELLHTFVMFTAPPMHRDYPSSVRIHEQWKKDFGIAYVSRQPKGIAVVGVHP